MTFEERKQECINRGIVPGAEIECAVDGKSRCKVFPVEIWGEYHDGSVWVANDQGKLHYGYDARLDNYAEVITPAAPTELDTIRDLEADRERLLAENAAIRAAAQVAADAFGYRGGPISKAMMEDYAITALKEQGITPTQL